MEARLAPPADIYFSTAARLSRHSNVLENSLRRVSAHCQRGAPRQEERQPARGGRMLTGLLDNTMSVVYCFYFAARAMRAPRRLYLMSAA